MERTLGKAASVIVQNGVIPVKQMNTESSNNGATSFIPVHLHTKLFSRYNGCNIMQTFSF